jgi:hypothetical protein
MHLIFYLILSSAASRLITEHAILSGEHTPFKDMTNRYTDENGEPAQGIRPCSFKFTVLYSQLSLTMLNLTHQGACKTVRRAWLTEFRHLG